MNGREPKAVAQLDALLAQYIQLKESYIALEADLAAARDAHNRIVSALAGCQDERDAARAEVARLRDARADDVALVARLSHQVVALRDAITRVLDGPHYIDRDYQDVLLAALDTPAREGGEGR